MLLGAAPEDVSRVDLERADAQRAAVVGEGAQEDKAPGVVLLVGADCGEPREPDSPSAASSSISMLAARVPHCAYERETQTSRWWMHGRPPGTVTEAPAAAGAGTVTVAIEVWDGRA